MAGPLVLIALGLATLALALMWRARRRPSPPAGHPDAPPALAEAKQDFERANAELLAAQEAWRAAAERVTATATRMTAIYQDWATARAGAALERNGGRRASVFDRLEQTDRLLARPLPTGQDAPDRNERESDARL